MSIILEIEISARLKKSREIEVVRSNRERGGEIRVGEMEVGGAEEEGTTGRRRRLGRVKNRLTTLIMYESLSGGKETMTLVRSQAADLAS